MESNSDNRLKIIHSLIVGHGVANLDHCCKLFVQTIVSSQTLLLFERTRLNLGEIKVVEKHLAFVWLGGGSVCIHWGRSSILARSIMTLSTWISRILTERALRAARFWSDWHYLVFWSLLIFIPKIGNKTVRHHQILIVVFLHKQRIWSFNSRLISSILDKSLDIVQISQIICIVLRKGLLSVIYCAGRSAWDFLGLFKIKLFLFLSVMLIYNLRRVDGWHFWS